MKQEFHERLKGKWKTWWKNSPHHDKFSRIDDQFPMLNFNKAKDNLMRKQASFIVQIRTGYVLVNKFLHRIKKQENAKCNSCLKNLGIEVTKSIQHFLFECKTYEREQHTFAQSIGRHSKDFKFIMSKSKNIEKLVKFMVETK